jgi:hypothetical protein
MSFNNFSSLPSNRTVTVQTQASFNDDAAIRFFINFYLNQIGSLYLTPFVNCCGIILNLICILFLISKELKGNIYKYFIVKTISELLICVLSILFTLSRCATCAFSQTYAGVFYRAIIFPYLIGITYNISNLTEIAMTYDRLTILKHNSEWFPKVDFKYMTLAIVTYNCLIYVPNLLAVRVSEPTVNSSRIDMTVTALGQTSAYNYYSIVIRMMSLPYFIILLLFNIFLLIEYRKYNRNRATIIGTLNNKSFMQPIENLQLENKSTLESTQRLESRAKSTFLETNNIKNSNKAENKIRKASTKENSEKMLAYSLLCCCLIYGINRLLNCTVSLINEIDSANQMSNSNHYRIFNFFGRFIAYIIFSSNLFCLALFNKAFKTHMTKEISSLYRKIFKCKRIFNFIKNS